MVSNLARAEQSVIEGETGNNCPVLVSLGWHKKYSCERRLSYYRKKMRCTLVTLSAVVFVISAAAIGIIVNRKEQERRLLDKLAHVTAEGTVKYKCSNNSKTADYESPNAAHPEIYLIAHRLEGEAATWRVQKPGLQPLSAHTFATNTGSIGGSQGLQWVEPDGSVTAATLSYSDVVEEYGPKTIWIALLNSDQKAGSYHVLPTALICGADAETFRDG